MSILYRNCLLCFFIYGFVSLAAATKNIFKYVLALGFF